MRSVVTLYRIAGLAGAGMVFATMLSPANKVDWLAAATLFFVAMLGGASYRLIVAVWLAKYQFAAATAWLSFLLCGIALVIRLDPAIVVAAHAAAINLAYALTRGSCLITGCCATTIGVKPAILDIRWLEIILCGALAALTVLLARIDPRYAAVAGIAGYIALRQFVLLARGGRNLWWPPLRQPGIDLLPHLLLGLVVVGAFCWG